MLLQADDCQLVLVDFQARLMPAIHDGAAVLANARRLAQMARWLQVPVWATEQVPAKLGTTDEALAALCERIVAKTAFSGAAELQPLLAPPAPPQRGNARSLPRHLQKPASAEPERGTLVLAGCEAHVCLLQTALDLLDQDWDVWVVTDACGSRTERNRDAAYDRLASAGGELVSTEMVGFEWLGDAGHPRFKDWQGLIR
ncbi:MAG: isochorismatase family protein [Burkholderiales bacterium]|uniref:Isochorismatase family protein n=1 Tax=Ottowia pentelensis TaxID=511108 RepID=A0ABV6PS03_9BURK|nr:isochorismatase family protein [Ottowia sp.]MBN9405169.1 isochorismatase family protein [Burkholderiales bacterium]MBS0401080.1 isochorismatase family protein [Pseudomonadota bacterium]MBS0415751.1 isochorismatase family protein [Pseudomonadota bacterium]HMN56816.1 isochorismatase family protein [Ottowia sp.]